MRRVMIIGQPGAGKSTLARAVAEIAHLPVIHVDRIHWQAGWRERPADEKTRLCLAAAARPRWVFEGGHARSWPARVARADTLLWIDLGAARRLCRVLRRTALYHGRSRPDLPPGCAERIRLDFLAYILRTRHSGRARCRALYEAAPPSVARHRLRSPSEVAAYLAALRRAASAGNLGISHR